MQPLAAQAEDIEAVLSRFQTWTGSRKNKDDQDGVREISYEEALRSSRYRWKTRTSEPSVAEPPAVSSLDASSDAELEVIPTAASEVAPAAMPFPESPVAAEKDITYDVRPRKSTSPPADFRSMLTQTVSTPETSLVRSRTGEPERQVSMSLRLAASEQALVKLRAAEAGLSASAYLRQCALEVEHLRAQMQILLEISQSPRKAPSPQPLHFLEKLRGLFSRTRKKADYTAETSSAGWLHRRELAG
jgi:hypothetical protein